jgi:uncharacterized heparinase superfamily protein
MTWGEAGRLWRTARHLRPGQIRHRVYYSARRWLWSRRPTAIDRRYRARAAGAGSLDWQHAGLARLAALRASRRMAGAVHRTADDVLEGRFTLLGEERDLGSPVSWDRQDLMQALLWKTHLHEFDYAVDLAVAARATGEARYREGFFSLARDWVEKQPIGKPGFHRVAWNERVVATRLMAWTVAGSLLGLRADEADAVWLEREVIRHALFLRDNLALDLLANHLFRDCVALAFAHELAGCCPDALALLDRQVHEQILPDGCHYERSPMYHAVCLEDLVDLHALLGEGAPSWLTDAVRRAAGFLETVQLGDGDIALLGDAWRGEVSVPTLLAEARGVAGTPIAPLEPEHWSGLVGLRSGPIRLVMRAGPHGPDFQLGHAHADLLSFELSRQGDRIVVDTGTSQYAAGPERMYLRSTAAHNTVQLDGAELLEVWSSFRAGRRGRARCHARGASAGFVWLWASHDGWEWLPGAPRHHRLIAFASDLVLVFDVIDGRGRHRVTSRLHLHPDATQDQLRILPIGASMRTEHAVLHERFGESRVMERRVVDCGAELPWLGGWIIDLADSGIDASLGLGADPSCLLASITSRSRQLGIRWFPGAEGGDDGVQIRENPTHR